MLTINEKKDGDSGYLASYRSQKVGVYASSSYAAQQLAAKHFKTRRTHEVSVYLCENPDGTQYVQVLN
jgi:hypothetical protein